MVGENMRNCHNKLGSRECLNSIDEITYDGTKKKIEFIEGYVKAWFHKVLLSQYNSYKGVIFIDCMSNCGVYSVEERDLFEGTSYRVLNSFSRQVEGKLIDKKFSVIVNDIEKDKVFCQNCLWNNNFKGKNKNLSFSSYSLDVNDFLSGPGRDILTEASKQNYHILLFYDPYTVQIDWEVLKHFISSKNVDLIITHFWQNDIKRSLNNGISQEKKSIIEKAYSMDFEALIKQYNEMTQYERNEFLRNKFKNQIEQSNYRMQE